MNFKVRTEDELSGVADALVLLIGQGYRVILLTGDMGTGKTTLTKVVCEKLGVVEPVSSPTFSIINEYASSLAGPIIHMDLYRLDKAKDLEQIGFGEYLDSGQVCLIEWPMLGESYFDMPRIGVDIRLDTDNYRIFNIQTYDTVDA